ncbi:cyclodeaminase/cyclohydrolase family protein [Caldilinea sp.]|uniref:cyclodeaminase/cyclohydrolase family protein n=1 Tax=Caldilinea sp. TaxID=2293560 RepID=UPI0021DD8BD9|nr:cyclodeaminase/cyclohydrolase family protein [Caldilinea sp.]GIV68477.1 MAG: methenyltetrahydrofolate cyclohydrolase [Caldilinea sp.]
MNTAEMKTIEFLDALAAGQPTPGGGGAAALTGGMAAALLSMVIHFTIGKKKYADVEAEMQEYLARTETLRRELLAAVDADAAAFDAVAATYALPKETEEQKAARTAAMQEALKHAAEVPFAVAEKCLALLQLAAPIGAKGNSNVVSDAATALYLAFAALKSALVNVNVNLKFIKDAAFVEAWSAKVADLLAEADDAYAQAKQAIETALEVAL